MAGSRLLAQYRRNLCFGILRHCIYLRDHVLSRLTCRDINMEAKVKAKPLATPQLGTCRDTLYKFQEMMTEIVVIDRS